MMFTEATIRRELRQLGQLKDEAIKAYDKNPSTEAASRVVLFCGAECALSWALNRKGDGTPKVSAY